MKKIRILPAVKLLFLISLAFLASQTSGQQAQRTQANNVKDLALRADTAAAIKALGDVSVDAATDDNIPTFLTGALGKVDVKLGIKSGANDLAPIIRKLAPIYRLTENDLHFTKVTEDDLGFSHAVYEQTKNGLPVVGTRLIVHISKTGEVYAATGNVRNDEVLSSVSKITSSSAVSKVATEFSANVDTKKTRLVYLVSTRDQKLYLAHEVPVSGTEKNGAPLDALVYVDAATGEIIDSHSQIMFIDRVVRNANYINNVAGTVVRTENSGPTGNNTYDKNFDYLGYTHSFFLSNFSRNSLNNAGLTLDSSTNFRYSSGTTYNNAFWYGPLNKIVFGDGDGTQFKNFALALDVAAHELTHGVTQYSSGLIYSNEPGAISESISDDMAAAVGSANGADDPLTFAIGENLYIASGNALRFMYNPTADGYSKDYYPERYTISAGTIPANANDYGYVHYNSGIGNLAFYLICQGGQHPRHGQYSSAAGGYIPNTSVTSLGITKAQAIFYRANTVYMGPGTQYMDLRQATVQSANDLYGSSDATSVAIAWDVVGVPTFSNRFPIALSTRAYIGTGENVLIAGIAISGGSTAKTMLIRGLGPYLTGLGVSGVLSDPRVDLYSGGSVIASNDDWSSSPDVSTIASLSSSLGAGTLANPSKDAAIIPSLSSGAYTAIVSGVGGTTGIGMVEAYDADSSNPNRLTAIATRAYVGTGENVTIVGFVITGSGNKTLLIRGLGPKLGSQGVSGYLADPQLSLYQGGTQIRYNNNWSTDENGMDVSFETANVASRVGAQSLTANSYDSALVVSLPAGAYTAILSGVSSTTGVGLIEVYEVN
jgi:vibriolysin